MDFVKAALAGTLSPVQHHDLLAGGAFHIFEIMTFPPFYHRLRLLLYLPRCLWTRLPPSQQPLYSCYPNVVSSRKLLEICLTLRLRALRDSFRSVGVTCQNFTVLSQEPAIQYFFWNNRILLNSLGKHSFSHYSKYLTPEFRLRCRNSTPEEFFFTILPILSTTNKVK